MADRKRIARLSRAAAAAMAALLARGAAAQETLLFEQGGLVTADPQAPLVIVADEMSYDVRGQVARASGAAEAVHGERVLRAETLEYDAAGGALRAAGDVVLANDDGSYLFAEDVALDAELSEGVIAAPRALIRGGGRFAAVSGERIDDRYTVLEKAVYSPCDVCPEAPDPLWRVRAGRVIHDEATRDVVYEDAAFDVLGTPVGYLPYFRHPDPSVKRRTGVLAPEFGLDDTLGYTVKTPYFIALAPDRDITLTPYFTTRDVLLLEGEYRALTETGGYRLAGVVTHNDRTGSDAFRGALEGEGRFDLPDPFRWGFDLDMATDDTFLRRYDYSDEDRVASRLFAIGETDRLYSELNGYYFQSFRANEPSNTVPWALPELRLRSRFLEDETLGVGIATANALQLTRAGGRDVSRLAAGVEWERRFIAGPGVVVTPFAAGRADAYLVSDDPAYDDDVQARVNALAGVEARMPFIASNNLGEHILEPVVQAIAAPYSGDSTEIPNEDSLDIEFDETTLFAAGSRFPGLDRWESGPRLNAGLRYSFESPGGLGVEAVYGRVFRLQDNAGFSATSGLRNTESDHVGALRLTLPPYLDVTHRIRLDAEKLVVRRNELYAGVEAKGTRLDLGYVFTEKDPLAGFVNDREELSLGGTTRIDEHWTAYGFGRRDLQRSRSVEARGGLRYEDECIAIDLSVSRRYNDDRDAQDGTNIGLRVRLKSLGA